MKIALVGLLLFFGQASLAFTLKNTAGTIQVDKNFECRVTVAGIETGIGCSNRTHFDFSQNKQISYIMLNFSQAFPHLKGAPICSFTSVGSKVSGLDENPTILLQKESGFVYITYKNYNSLIPEGTKINLNCSIPI